MLTHILDTKGIIYQATNFVKEGNTSAGRVIVWDGKRYHDKAIRTYHVNKNGEKILKPFAIRLKQAVDDGEAYYVNTPGKIIYTYKLSKR